MCSILATFLVYAVLLFLIANTANKMTTGKYDYFLAGRSLSGALTAFGAGASDMSSWLLMVLPGLVYASGVNNIWMPLALTVGAFANWKLVAKRLRLYTEVANDSYTLPSYLHNRFNSKDCNNRKLKIASGISMLIFFHYLFSFRFYCGRRSIENDLWH